MLESGDAALDLWAQTRALPRSSRARETSPWISGGRLALLRSRVGVGRRRLGSVDTDSCSPEVEPCTGDVAVDQRRPARALEISCRSRETPPWVCGHRLVLSRGRAVHGRRRRGSAEAGSRSRDLVLESGDAALDLWGPTRALPRSSRTRETSPWISGGWLVLWRSRVGVGRRRLGSVGADSCSPEVEPRSGDVAVDQRRPVRALEISCWSRETPPWTCGRRLVLSRGRAVFGRRRRGSAEAGSRSPEVMSKSGEVGAPPGAVSRHRQTSSRGFQTS